MRGYKSPMGAQMGVGMQATLSRQYRSKLAFEVTQFSETHAPLIAHPRESLRKKYLFTFIY